MENLPSPRESLLWASAYRTVSVHGNCWRGIVALFFPSLEPSLMRRLPYSPGAYRKTDRRASAQPRISTSWGLGLVDEIDIVIPGRKE